MPVLPEVLISVAQLQNATIVQQLTDGPLCDKWQVRVGADEYAVRIDRPLARRMGLDRTAELDVLTALAEKGLTAAPVWSDVSQGILVLEWVSGVSWTAAALRANENLARLAGLLSQLHALEARVPALDLAARARHYAGIVASGDAMRRADQVAELLRGADDGQRCLCHNDPVAGNVVAGPSLGLIDYEYAAPGNPCFDLAIVAEHHELGPDEEKAFLAAYREQGSGPDSHTLAPWRQIYRLIRQLWSDAIAAGSA